MNLVLTFLVHSNTAVCSKFGTGGTDLFEYGTRVNWPAPKQHGTSLKSPTLEKKTVPAAGDLNQRGIY